MTDSLRLKSITKGLRWLPAGTAGKTRLARRLLGSTLQATDVSINARGGATYITPSLAEPIAFHLLVDGVYEPTALNFVLKRLTGGAVFFDVGANIGVFTLPAAEKVGTTGRVVAIEPSPRVFPYLQRNVQTNRLLNVDLVHCAAIDLKSSEVSFYEAPADHFGMGSMGAQFYTEPISVPGKSLDSIADELSITHIDIIKVDVEGFEAGVFRGGEGILRSKKSPIVVFEFCDWAESRVPSGEVGDAQTLLMEWGYSIWRLEDHVAGLPPLRNPITAGFETLVGLAND